MLLAIDVGNTQTVVGIYQDGSLQYRWRVATNKSHTSDELRVKLVPLLASEGLKLDDVRGVALASVVPALTMAWCAAAYRMIGKDALVCSAETAGSLFEADYPNPHEIGADRVADAVAAKALYGAPVIVVDFGTATNMEVVDADGRFIGGGIPITPKADVTDGLFDIQLVDAVPRWKIPFYLPSLMMGTLFKHPPAHNYRASSCTLSSPGMRLQLDGEILPVEHTHFVCESDALLMHW